MHILKIQHKFHAFNALFAYFIKKSFLSFLYQLYRNRSKMFCDVIGVQLVAGKPMGSFTSNVCKNKIKSILQISIHLRRIDSGCSKTQNKNCNLLIWQNECSGVCRISHTNFTINGEYIKITLVLIMKR